MLTDILEICRRLNAFGPQTLVIDEVAYTLHGYLPGNEHQGRFVATATGRHRLHIVDITTMQITTIDTMNGTPLPADLMLVPAYVCPPTARQVVQNLAEAFRDCPGIDLVRPTREITEDLRRSQIVRPRGFALEIVELLRGPSMDVPSCSWLIAELRERMDDQRDEIFWTTLGASFVVLATDVLSRYQTTML